MSKPIYTLDNNGHILMGHIFFVPAEGRRVEVVTTSDNAPDFVGGEYRYSAYATPKAAAAYLQNGTMVYTH